MIILFIAATFLSAGSSLYSQKYTTTADTIALNAEYLKLTNDIAALNISLDKARSEQDKQVKKSAVATSDAQSTASKAIDKAEQSTGESVKDARKAKRQARKSVKDAKDARHAKGDLDDANKKVEKLSGELQKKQDRLNELNNMRSTIELSVPR
ncbi:MAG: hypothetical protein ABIO82_05285 [Ginsengibacter sp.]